MTSPTIFHRLPRDPGSGIARGVGRTGRRPNSMSAILDILGFVGTQ